MKTAPRTQTFLDTARFVQVCLHSVLGIPREAACISAAALLRDFNNGTDFPKNMLSQVAIFTNACDDLGALRKSGAHKKLTALLLREQRRDALVQIGRDEVLRTCKNLKTEFTEIQGPMIAQKYYPNGESRHTHALKFAVLKNADHEALVSMLMRLGWRQLRQEKLEAELHRAVLASPTNVEAVIYRRFFPHTNFVPPAPILETPEFQTAMILCQTQFEPQKVTMRWFFDLAFVLSKHDIDEKLVGSLIGEFGLAKSCVLALRECHLYIPENDSSHFCQKLAKLLQHIEAEFGKNPRNTRGANRALRTHTGKPQSLMRRTLSRMKRLLSLKQRPAPIQAIADKIRRLTNL